MGLLQTLFGKPKNQPLLARVPIAGLQYYRAAELQELMQQGDELTLAHEADNPHDPNAVIIFWNRNKIGYIPSEHAKDISTMLDRCQNLYAKIEEIDPASGEGRWVKLSLYPR